MKGEAALWALFKVHKGFTAVAKRGNGIILSRRGASYIHRKK